MRRTLSQNDLMWSMLQSYAEQLPWHGQILSKEDYKLIFLDGLSREFRVVPNLEGNGFVSLGRSSSKLSKDEMSQMIELMRAFGVRHGIRFIDDREAA